MVGGVRTVTKAEPQGQCMVDLLASPLLYLTLACVEGWWTGWARTARVQASWQGCWEAYDTYGCACYMLHTGFAPAQPCEEIWWGSEFGWAAGKQWTAVRAPCYIQDLLRLCPVGRMTRMDGCIYQMVQAAVAQALPCAQGTWAGDVV